MLRWFDERVIDGAVNGAAVITRLISRSGGWFDDRVVDGVVNGTARAAGYAGGLLGRVQTGRVQNYIVYIIFSFIVLFILFR